MCSSIHTYIYPVCMCKGNVIGLRVCRQQYRHKNHQFGRSRYLRDLQANKSIRIGEKVASLCFKLLATAHKCHKSAFSCPLTTTPTYCRPCALCTCTQLTSTVSHGCQYKHCASTKLLFHVCFAQIVARSVQM